MKYDARQGSVEANQHLGPRMVVMSSLKGEQACNTGDFIVVDEEAVKVLRNREKLEGVADGSLGNRGTVYVVPKAEFLKTYDAEDGIKDETLKVFPATQAIDVGKVAADVALEKSSGIDGDAGDWTAAGQDKDGFPVPKGSAEDVTEPAA